MTGLIGVHSTVKNTAWSMGTGPHLGSHATSRKVQLAAGKADLAMVQRSGD